jgi:hypothetical protein
VLVVVAGTVVVVAGVASFLTTPRLFELSSKWLRLDQYDRSSRGGRANYVLLRVLSILFAVVGVVMVVASL